MTTDTVSRGFYDWRQSLLDSKIPAMTKLVLLVIHTHMNTKTSSAFPSYDTVAKEASLGRRAVITHIQQAVELGWLRKQSRSRDDGGQTSNLYVMTDPKTETEVLQEFRVGGAPETPPQCILDTPPVHEEHPNSQSNNQLKVIGIPAKTIKKGLQSTIDTVKLSEMGVVDEWEEFRKHRKALKAPMTEYAEKRMIQQLSKLSDNGHDPKAVLIQSITNGWKGVFELKTGGHQHENNQSASRRFASGRAIGRVKKDLAESYRKAVGDETL